MNVFVCLCVFVCFRVHSQACVADLVVYIIQGNIEFPFPKWLHWPNLECYGMMEFACACKIKGSWYSMQGMKKTEYYFEKPTFSKLDFFDLKKMHW